MGRKWNNIKMKKAAQDKARSQNWTKVLREVTMAVRNSGAEVESNFALKVALQKARDCNVSKDNVDKAIKKGLGEGGEDYYEINYEGYGLDGVAVFVEATTNNPTRTIGNVRNFFTKCGGAIGKEGCLQFVFERKAVFTIKDAGQNIDDLTLELIDFGVEDVEKEDGFITLKGAVESFGSIYKKLEEMGIKVEESGLERIPLSTKEVTNKESYDKNLKMVDLLEGDDDVIKVYHNMDYNEKFSG
ncbi:MAG: YebC/PmpR family DNA-binding transcriptional regulator [Bacteriovoracaceae bacterium]|nr:YebC/PmpR family DNA-binding transcriptional regulator [Bacteriovoracaceae bacterium]